MYPDEYTLIKGQSRAGLVQVQRQVSRGGKTFTQNYWVKSSDVKSTDTVLSKPDDNAKQTHSDNPQPTSTKQMMVGLLSQHGRPGVISHAKSLGVTWKEDTHEGINWMRASMAIQNHMKSNPNDWNNVKIDTSDDASKNTPPIDHQDAKKPSDDAKKPSDDAKKPSDDAKKPSDDAKKPSDDAKKPSDDAKKHVKELASTMGKSDLMSAAKANGITWNENPHEGVNWMRASMAIAKALSSNPDVLSNSTQKAELKVTQEKIKKLEDLVSKVVTPTAQQVKKQSDASSILQGITTNFKSKREEKVFGSELSKATPKQFVMSRTLGMCGSDDDSNAYLERLYGHYIKSVNKPTTLTKNKDIDDDPLRNKLQGVVNKQVVGVVKSSLVNARKRTTQFQFKQTLLEPWVDPNSPLSDEQLKAINGTSGGSMSGTIRKNSMTETELSHNLMHRVLDKLSLSKEYGSLAKEYKDILTEYDTITKGSKYIQTLTSGTDKKPFSASYYQSSLQHHELDTKEKLDKFRDTYYAEDKARFENLAGEIEKRMKDPTDTYFYLPPNPTAQQLESSKKSQEKYTKWVTERWENSKKRLDEYENDYNEAKLLNVTHSKDPSGLMQAEKIRRSMYDPKFTDINVNLYHFKAIGSQLAYQYQIKKDFVSEYPILSKDNIDKLESGDEDALTNLSLYAGMFKPSLAKDGKDAQEVILDKYKERQDLLETYGALVQVDNASGMYSEDNEIKCKVSKAPASVVQKITSDISKDWDKKNHGGMKYRIKGVYQVSGLAVEKEFDTIKKQREGNKDVKSNQNTAGKNPVSDLFYHGTGAMATSLILGHSGEFKVGKAKVGRMLGNGIYVADKSSKSAQYISDEGFARHGMQGSLMVVEASLGTLSDRYSGALANSKTDSVFGGTQHGLKNNEWCVHDPKAVIPRYLVEMEIM